MSGYEWHLRSEGFDEALHDLRALEASLQHGAVRAGLVRAIAPTKRLAKRLAPQDTGAMARAIGHRSLSKSAKSRLGIPAQNVALLVGPNRKVNGRWQGRKGMWQELGTEHMEANPFMTPALEQTQSGMAGRFYHGLRDYLDRKGLRT
uniref:HK97-gp10 family putative phage morphogenesis protein n=1 Tax=Halomonas sp. TaxID=1486246 RepID=UPI002610AFB9|nr:HK97-gp10 family putative phage morphogenesis protein [Halomonas sp.]